MHYTLGIDFGTLSARCVVAETTTGAVVAAATYDYPHGVIENALPGGAPLKPDTALQHPADYREALIHTVREAVKKSGVSPSDIVGIGVDFTSCTLLPVKKDGTPLCLLPKYTSVPAAYAKLWKHHAAQPEANTINDRYSTLPWVQRFGGRISSESQLPKVLETLHDAPEVFDDADYYMEGGDWIVMLLTGVPTKNICAAAFKGAYDSRTGYPDAADLAKLHPKLPSYVSEKLAYPIVYLGEKVGELTAEMAEILGLHPGIAVAAACVDAHAGLPAVKANQEGQLMAIVGTSSGLILVSDREKIIDGLSGVTMDSVYKGMFCYEAGQTCVGDHFAWAVKTCLAPDYAALCREKDVSPHTLLNELAAKYAPGETGLLALDWWNGNRCILEDADVSGVMLGFTLQTKPEEIYRALLEAHTFGVRIIIDQLRLSGIAVNEIIAGGGIPYKSPLLMQIYADVMNLPIKISGTDQSGALGSAIMAASAAGEYPDLITASEAMGSVSDVVYYPIPEHVAVYEKLYREFVTLHDYFGRGENDVMKRLKALKTK